MIRTITTVMIHTVHMFIFQLQYSWFSSYPCPSENYNSHDSHLTHVLLTITTAMIHKLHMSIWKLRQAWFTSYTRTHSLTNSLNHVLTQLHTYVIACVFACSHIHCLTSYVPTYLVIELLPVWLIFFSVFVMKNY